MAQVSTIISKSAIFVFTFTTRQWFLLIVRATAFVPCGVAVCLLSWLIVFFWQTFHMCPFLRQRWNHEICTLMFFLHIDNTVYSVEVCLVLLDLWDYQGLRTWCILVALCSSITLLYADATASTIIRYIFLT